MGTPIYFLNLKIFWLVAHEISQARDGACDPAVTMLDPYLAEPPGNSKQSSFKTNKQNLLSFLLF